MALRFITGNAGKFREVEALLGVPLIQVAIDLPELQSLDTEAVLRAKVEAALAYVEGPFIIEDSSLTLSCLGDALPGPFIKWFEGALGNEKIAELVAKMGDNRAEVTTSFAYVSPSRETSFFTASVNGVIVPPRGDKDFGYGPLFQPEGSLLTYGEMEREEKHQISSRALAAQKLRTFLEKT